MKRRIVYWIFLLCFGILSWSQEARTENQAADTKPYRNFFYNYPHEVPTDYLYRTDRIFTPEWKKEQGFLGWLPSLSSFFVTKSSEVSAPSTPSENGIEFKLKIRELGQQLITNSHTNLADEYAVVISTFVNLQNLYKTSSLGRYISEQLIGELQRAGFDVVDVRKTPGVIIREELGEYGLSRDMKELSFAHPAQAVIVGTYSVTEQQIFVNARVLRNTDAMVLSSATMVCEQSALMRQMLLDESTPPRPVVPVHVRALNDLSKQGSTLK